MTRHRVVTTAARAYCTVIPAVWTVFFTAQGVFAEPGALVPAAAGAVATWWTSRVALVLDTDSLVVTNALWRHRVPYADIVEVEVERVDLLGNEKLPILYTHRLAVLTDYGHQSAMATMWLNSAALLALRGRVTELAEKFAAEEEDTVDTSPPYDDVRAVLLAARGTYDDLDADADVLAFVLREQRLTCEDLDGVLGSCDEDLLRALNATWG